MMKRTILSIIILLMLSSCASDGRAYTYDGDILTPKSDKAEFIAEIKNKQNQSSDLPIQNNCEHSDSEYRKAENGHTVHCRMCRSQVGETEEHVTSDYTLGPVIHNYGTSGLYVYEQRCKLCEGVVSFFLNEGILWEYMQ